MKNIEGNNIGTEDITIVSSSTDLQAQFQSLVFDALTAYCKGISRFIEAGNVLDQFLRENAFIDERHIIDARLFTNQPFLLLEYLNIRSSWYVLRTLRCINTYQPPPYSGKL